MIPPRPHHRLTAVGLFLLTIAAYLPTLSNGFIWDDDAYVEHNPALRSPAGLVAIWTDPSATPQYYPLVHTVFWIEYHLWGTSPGGYHAVDLLIHATSVVVLWRLLRRLDVPAPALAAGLFAVHPLQVESVAWVTELKNVLSGLFYLLAAGAYLRREDFKSEISNFKFQIPAFVLFLLALTAKTVTATLPAAVLLVIYWKRGRVTRRDVIPLLPFFVAGATAGGFTGYLERGHVGAAGAEWSALHCPHRILIAGRAVWFYAGKFVFPHPQSFIYPRWTIVPADPAQWLYPIAAIGVLLLLFAVRNKIGRGPLVAVLFFAGTLFPALGFANVYPMRYSFVADHFQYLAIIGLSCLTAAVFARYTTRMIVPVVLIACATITFNRTSAYADRETLWRDTLVKNPGSWMVHTNLAHALETNGDKDGAWAEYQAAEALAPDSAEPRLNFAMGFAVHGDYARATAECRRAIQLDPAYAPAHANLAKLLLTQNHPDQAVAPARESIRLAPGFWLGHESLARALEARGDVDAAITEYTTAAAQNPDDATLQKRLATALAAAGRYAEAMPHFDAAKKSSR